MGLILDSSVLITAERKAQTVRQLIESLRATFGDSETALSVITLVELAHGAARANSATRRAMRQQFIQELLLALPVHGVSAAIGLRAGQIDGENQARGVRLPLSDLLIGVTALELGYGVATHNLRHFKLIPGLAVTEL